MVNGLRKNLKSLDYDYVPRELPTREKDRDELLTDLNQFYTVSEFNNFTSWFIHGPVGSGKTVLSKRIASDLTERLGDSLKVTYINCRNEKKVYNVLTRMVTNIEDSLPKRGFSREELINIYVSLLLEKNISNLLILDEIDGLFYSGEGEKANDFLYTLSRVWEEREAKGSKLAILLVTRDQSLVYKWLDDATRSSLLKKVKKLNRYSYEDLLKILNYRAKLAFDESSFDDEVLEMIAHHVAENLRGNMRGNARIAIDLLKDSALIALSEQRDYITPNDVRKAIMRNPNTEPVDDEIFLSLGKQKLLLLLAIARAMKQFGGAYVTRRQVTQLYNIICEEYGVEPRKTTQLFKYLKSLAEELKGAISITVNSKGQRGRSTHITLNIPPDDLERKVLKFLGV